MDQQINLLGQTRRQRQIEAAERERLADKQRKQARYERQQADESSSGGITSLPIIFIILLFIGVSAAVSTLFTERAAPKSEQITD